MKFAFRVDASAGIGSGHVFRCLNIAKELRGFGHLVIFFMRDNPNSLIEDVRGAGFKVVVIPSFKSQTTSGPFELDVKRDAAYFIDVCLGFEIDRIVVDHYGADITWETLVSAQFRTLAIDDFSDREHKSDIVLNPNLLSPDHATLLAKKSGDSVTISGLEFIPIRSVSKYLPTARATASTNQSISVYFGADDAYGLSYKVTKILVENLQLKNLIHVLVGINSSSREEVVVLSQNFPNVIVHDFTDDLGLIFSQAPISIGAGGSTIWERLLYKNKCLVIAVAENQMAISESLHSLKIISFVGLYSEFDSDNLSGALQTFISSIMHDDWNLSSLDFDRDGASRIAALLSLSSGDLSSFHLALSNSSSQTESNYSLDLCWRNHIICKVDVKVSKKTLSVNKSYSNFANAIERTSAINLEALVLKLLHIRYPQLYLSEFPISEFRILILLSSTSWINDYLWGHLGSLLLQGYSVRVAHEIREDENADFCVLLGFDQILSEQQISKFQSVLVVHESDLPKGRGWSPMTWRLLNGEDTMILTLLEAAPKVDSGRILASLQVSLNGTELLPELREIQISKSILLVKEFLLNYPSSLNSAQIQIGQPTYFARRSRTDSRCSPDATLNSIFNLLRISDSRKYPVFFEKNGAFFRLRIDRIVMQEVNERLRRQK
jgi:methionyl-tRNA formyltransferase